MRTFTQTFTPSAYNILDSNPTVVGSFTIPSNFDPVANATAMASASFVTFTTGTWGVYTPPSGTTTTTSLQGIAVLGPHGATLGGPGTNQQTPRYYNGREMGNEFTSSLSGWAGSSTNAWTMTPGATYDISFITTGTTPYVHGVTNTAWAEASITVSFNYYATS